MDEEQPQHPYYDLSPDRVLDAVEALGLPCDGRMLALNSYENRVYQVGIEDGTPVVVKFYRPGRWSDEQILEEHAFSWELAEREIPVVPPMRLHDRTLHHQAGHRLAVFERRGGRAPELEDLDQLEWIGRFIGRIHGVGSIRPFEQRPQLTAQSFGRDSAEFLLQEGFVEREYAATYRALIDELLGAVEAAYAQAGDIALIRLHGDCHPGNVLWRDSGPHFVDLDDARMGPAVQDLWMMLSGERQERTLQLDALLAGYTEFQSFDPRQLHLVEALRTLRMIYYAAWLARRWNDPAFHKAFPWFNTPSYWQEHINALREQLPQMAEPPLMWMG